MIRAMHEGVKEHVSCATGTATLSHDEDCGRVTCFDTPCGNTG